MRFFLKSLFFAIVTLMVVPAAYSQSALDSGYVVRSTVHQGDTIPLFQMQPVPIYGKRTFKSKREERKYGRLQRYVVKVYPYAKIAGEMLRYYDDTLKTFRTDRARKRYLKKVEEQLKDEFGGELKKLTINQGIILVKLIDRETGNTSYDLIQQFRGSFSAFIWQSLARLFGSNLKLEYDPNGEDMMIEEIVQKIERGELEYVKRQKRM